MKKSGSALGRRGAPAVSLLTGPTNAPHAFKVRKTPNNTIVICTLFIMKIVNPD